MYIISFFFKVFSNYFDVIIEQIFILFFSKYDLYTKGGKMPDVDELKPYYQKLIDKYIPGELDW